MPFEPEAINQLLDKRIRDVASRKGADSLQDQLNRIRDDRPKLMRCLGLDPIPPLSDLAATVTGVIQRDGYRIEKIAYRSRPNFSVTAHLYLPESSIPVPVIIRPHGHWAGKKSEPVVQASAIGLVLSGYAVMVIDSPGDSGEPDELNERADEGSHDDPWLAMGRAYEGFYVWDIMRGIDYLLTRPEIVGNKIGITGASGGGLATMYAFAVDERISCAAPVCYAVSMEVEPKNGCLCNHVPGVLALGDRADVLALRAPAPILLVGATDDPEFPPAGHQKSYDKLRHIYRRFDRQSRVRLEIVESGHDYNRRMRETVLAFFDEQLKGAPHRSYTPEPRPITDGYHNPSPSETVDVTSAELRVLPLEPRHDTTMREFMERSFVTEGLAPFEIEPRLAPWAKYGKLLFTNSDRILRLEDKTLALDRLDQRICTYLGLGVCEAYAQMLHIMLPGGMEGWETSTLGPTGDVVSSLIGSMKALIGSTGPQTSITEVHANGPGASLVAKFLSLFRPGLTYVTSHDWSSWRELYETGDSVLMEPLAIYYKWPFDKTILPTPVTENETPAVTAEVPEDKDVFQGYHYGADI